MCSETLVLRSLHREPYLSPRASDVGGSLYVFTETPGLFTPNQPTTTSFEEGLTACRGCIPTIIGNRVTDLVGAGDPLCSRTGCKRKSKSSIIASVCVLNIITKVFWVQKCLQPRL